MKSAEERMHIVDKYRELGSYRAAARACGVDHKTVKAVVQHGERGEVEVQRAPVVREHNYDAVAGLVRRRVEQTRGRDDSRSVDLERMVEAIKARQLLRAVQILMKGWLERRGWRRYG